jgi:hypothetical protein
LFDRFLNQAATHAAPVVAGFHKQTAQVPEIFHQHDADNAPVIDAFQVNALLRMVECPAHVREDIGDDLVHFRLVDPHAGLDGLQHHGFEAGLIGGLDCFDFHRIE